MSVAGVIFEPHPPNFNITFKDVKMIFDISTGFRF